MIAIMQPYFFPYLGYFELIKKADLFIFLNDVQYKRGWINRNRIVSKDKKFQYITIPVKKHSQKTNIRDILVNDWIELTKSHLVYVYGQKDHEIYSHISTLTHPYLKDILHESIKWTCNHLGIQTVFENSDGISENKGADKLIDICNHFGEKDYINLSGGKDLYSHSYFEQKGITLHFMDEFKGDSLSVINSILGNK